MSEFQPPTAEQVKEALRRIPTPQLRRAFYEGLKNPLWLEPLMNEGAFRTPPPRVTMEDGSVGDTYWPEIEYVVRVAADSPRVAVEVLLSLKDSDNAWVRRALFAVGTAVPAAEAARLKPVIKAWVSSGFGWRTDPREMIRFAVNLLTGGERKTGEWVANALFRPGIREDSNKPDLVLEGYWYEGGLPEVVEALGASGLPTVLDWLVRYERAAGKSEWSFSRPSIRERRDPHRDVEDALIDAVRDLSVARMAPDPDGTANLLLGAGSMVARRIAMFAATEALRDAAPGSTSSGALVVAGVRLLFDPPSNDERCRIEFGELARQLGRHDPGALEPLVRMITAGPPQGAADLRERLRRDEDESEAEGDTRIAEYVERWEHSWLASVGAEALPAALITRLADLDDRLGVIEDPLHPPFMITSWTGPNSPLSQDEMAGMSAEELVSHLESWHDNGNGWGPEPSHEGQARELTALLSANPRFLSGVADLVQRLRPTYLRAILHGWSAAFKTNLDLDWVHAANLIGDVLDHGDELDFPREGGDMDDDADFRWVKQAAVSLIADLAKRSEPRRVPEDTVTRLAQLLMAAASDETAWSVYAAEVRESGMDPLTVSLNWQWPILLRGLTALVGYGPSTPWSDAVRAALLTELDRPDPRGAAHAVMGENLARLLNADEVWTQAQVGRWFGGAEGIDDGQQVALSTAMAIHHYHRTLFSLLTPAMLAALDLTEPVVDGWQHHGSSPTQRIGEWAVKAIIYGFVGWHDPVVAKFFATVDPTERGAALGHVAWEFMHANSVDDDIRDRFAEVWDARIAHVEAVPDDSAELRDFYWVVRSEKFDPAWWLPRLRHALELDPELAAQRYMIGKDIAAAASLDARTAFDVIRALSGHRQPQGLGILDLSRNAVPVVIARALASDDEGLRAEATLFMNELGEAGQLELARQVQAVLDGTISADDVTEF
jgi:hypothetical protein